MTRGVDAYRLIIALRKSVLAEKSGEMGLISRIVTVFLLGAVLSGVCYGQGYALMVQQSPSDGGVTIPSAGVHQMDVAQSLPLTAVAKPGYRFVSWLGDVSDTATRQTTTQMDSPKIVVAIFERIDDEIVVATEAAVAGASAGGTVRSASPFTAKSSASVGSSGGGTVEQIVPTVTEPVPEPATGIILASGILVALRRRTSKKETL